MLALARKQAGEGGIVKDGIASVSAADDGAIMVAKSPVPPATEWSLSISEAFKATLSANRRGISSRSLARRSSKSSKR